MSRGPGATGPMPTDWTVVAKGPETHRLKVPGGWLYFVKPMYLEPCLTFVPEPKNYQQGD